MRNSLFNNRWRYTSRTLRIVLVVLYPFLLFGDRWRYSYERNENNYVKRKSTKLKKFKQPNRTLILIISAFVEFYLLTREKHQDTERKETKLKSFQKWVGCESVLILDWKDNAYIRIVTSLFTRVVRMVQRHSPCGKETERVASVRHGHVSELYWSINK